jgi:hypothetical protein
MRKAALLSLALLAAASVASAQAPTRNPAAPEDPVGHSGPLISFTDESVTLNEKGKPVVVAMTRGWSVATVRTVRADSIKRGDFIASIYRDIDANTGRSTEARLFEAGYRPEIGAHPMPAPGMSIVHGTVASSTQTSAGQVVDVVYPGGARVLIVPPEARVTTSDLQERSFAKPGMVAGAVTRRGSDDVFRAGRITVTAP